MVGGHMSKIAFRRKVERITNPDNGETIGFYCVLCVVDADRTLCTAYGFGDTGSDAMRHANDSAAKQGYR
jgi:hypothetical protein